MGRMRTGRWSLSELNDESALPKSDQPRSKIILPYPTISQDSSCSHHHPMTRITNFGRKRTHVEATFSYNEGDLEDPDVEPSLEVSDDKPVTAVTNSEGVETTEDGRGVDGQPPKKKRKRGPRKKAGAKVTTEATDGGERGEKEALEGEGAERNSKGKRGKAKSRSLQGPSPLTTSACFKFTRAPSRTQRNFRKTAPQASSRAKCQHHLFRLSREGPRRTGVSQNCRWIHQAARQPKWFQRDRSCRDLLPLWLTETPTLSLS